MCLQRERCCPDRLADENTNLIMITHKEDFMLADLEIGSEPKQMSKTVLWFPHKSYPFQVEKANSSHSLVFTDHLFSCISMAYALSI